MTAVPRSGARLAPPVWLLWLAVAATLAMVLRHPLYAVMVLLIAVWVAEARGVETAALPVPLWRIGAAILFFSGLFQLLFVHSGATVLARLPAGWPLIGGPLTLEALVFGWVSGLTLLALLAVFTAFNRVVPVDALVRLAPRALRDVGVIVVIVLTYIPETLRHLQRIREAQAIRGHQLRGLRDWRPLVLPLLVGGLERALNLAEAMVSRGFGSSAARPLDGRGRLALVVGLLLLLVGWAGTVWAPPFGRPLLALGALAVVGAVWRAGRSGRWTTYRPNPLTPVDWLVAALLCVPPLVVLLWPAGLIYQPFPRLTWPDFEPVIGGGLLLLAAPLLAQRKPHAASD